MFVADPQFARSDVLRIFNHAQVYLSLGAGITTVGLLAGAFSLLRRRFDPLLLWFALFAILYGLRLEMDHQLLWALGLQPAVFQRVALAIGFLVPIPAFFFFYTLDIVSRPGRIVAAVISPIVFSLAILTLLVGPRDLFRNINNVVVIAALIALVARFPGSKAGTSDLTLIRGGLLIFSAGAVYDNVTGIFGHYYDVEPFGFVIFLAALGVAAGRRTLANEQQLSIIQKELEIAQRIQLSILPGLFPSSESFRVAARYLPMTAVAGDFYDFLVAGDHKAGLLIADVSGHGVPAALIASMVKLAATSERASAGSPSDVLLGMNNTLCGNTQNQFVTAAYVYLDAVSRELRYSAAGHPPMLLIRNGAVVEVAENGLMLAAFSFATYTTITCPIEPGDRLMLYTDGLLEAANVQHEEYGRERLHELALRTYEFSPADAVDRIISSVQQWAATQNDDLTVLICDYCADNRHRSQPPFSNI